MATTPNYGWVTPAPTDLVTDLPADFEIFADAVDADLAGLLGGTTGQVLKKTSGTDHDFAFGVDPTFDLVTTAGDLVYGTAADTMARLGIGTAGQVLTVNSGATAPEWATASGGGTTLINTGGTSLTGASVTISSIPTTYQTLVIVIKDVYADVAAGTQFRFNGDTGNNYYQGSTAESSWTNMGSLTTTNTVAEKNYGVLTMPQYAQTSGQQVGIFQGFDNFNNLFKNTTHWYTKSAAITSVTFKTANDNFAGGTIWVYGVS